MVIVGIVLIEFLSALINVWVDCGKCFIAPADADTNVWTDCGRCFIAFADADTNVCIEPEALPPSPTLIVNVPSCLCIPLILAVTNVCWAVYDDGPTFISKVFTVTLDILNHLPLG